MSEQALSKKRGTGLFQFGAAWKIGIMTAQQDIPIVHWKPNPHEAGIEKCHATLLWADPAPAQSG